MMNNLTLTLLSGEFAIHRLPPDSPIPPQVLSGVFYAVTRTADELSIVCPANVTIPNSRREGDWACLKVAGPLDFGLTGVLAGLSGTLARAGVSIFALSTYDTDYLLVKNDGLPQAVAALRDAGYAVDSALSVPADPTPVELTRIRRHDRAIYDDAWIVAFLRRAEYGVLATCRDGQPFTVARNFIYDEARHALYLHGARRGQTFDLVREGALANFNVSQMGRLLPAKKAVDLSVEYASVVIFGRVSLVADVDEAIRALRFLSEKYFPHLRYSVDYAPVSEHDLKRTAILRLDVEAWSGKQKQVAENYPGAFHFGEPV